MIVEPIVSFTGFDIRNGEIISIGKVYQLNVTIDHANEIMNWLESGKKFLKIGKSEFYFDKNTIINIVSML